MLELLASIAALGSGYTGWALLALSQREHRFAAAGELPPPSARRHHIVRLLAVLLLAGALGAWVAGHGGGFGTLLWMLLLAAGALAVAFTLAWRPRWSRAPDKTPIAALPRLAVQAYWLRRCAFALEVLPGTPSLLAFLMCDFV
jgi:Protein of unknown function (DUF3325)